jgi:hypothetical protein
MISVSEVVLWKRWNFFMTFWLFGTSFENVIATVIRTCGRTRYWTCGIDKLFCGLVVCPSFGRRCFGASNPVTLWANVDFHTLHCIHIRFRLWCGHPTHSIRCSHYDFFIKYQQILRKISNIRLGILGAHIKFHEKKKFLRSVFSRLFLCYKITFTRFY